MEKEEVKVVVILSEEVPKNSAWVTTLDLIGRQAKVDALHKIPQLGNKVRIESPKRQSRQSKAKHDDF